MDKPKFELDQKVWIDGKEDTVIGMFTAWSVGDMVWYNTRDTVMPQREVALSATPPAPPPPFKVGDRVRLKGGPLPQPYRPVVSRIFWDPDGPEESGPLRLGAYRIYFESASGEVFYWAWHLELAPEPKWRIRPVWETTGRYYLVGGTGKPVLEPGTRAILILPESTAERIAAILNEEE